MSTPPILVWDQAYNRSGDAKLPRAVVNAIRTYMDNDSLTGWVSQETLARDTGLDESNVRRQIKKNVAAGWLVVTKRGRAGRASEYRLTYRQPGADARLDTETDQALTAQICTVTDEGSNRAQTPGYSSQPGEYARLLPGADAHPTSPGLLLKEKSYGEGTKVPDPFGGSDDRSNRSEAEIASPTQPGTNARLEDRDGRPPAAVWPVHPAAGDSDDPFASGPVPQPARQERAARLRPPVPYVAHDDPFAD